MHLHGFLQLFLCTRRRTVSDPVGFCRVVVGLHIHATVYANFSSDRTAENFVRAIRAVMGVFRSHVLYRRFDVIVSERIVPSNNSLFKISKSFLRSRMYEYFVRDYPHSNEVRFIVFGRTQFEKSYRNITIIYSYT